MSQCQPLVASAAPSSSLPWDQSLGWRWELWMLPAPGASLTLPLDSSSWDSFQEGQGSKARGKRAEFGPNGQKLPTHPSVSP